MKGSLLDCLLLPFHHHDIRSHLDVALIFVRIVYIVNYPVYGYFCLFLLDFRIIPYHPSTLVGVTETVIYYPIWNAKFRCKLCKSFASGIEA